MKKIIILTILTFSSCIEKKPNFIDLVNISVRLNKLETPIVVYKTPENLFIGNSKNIKLLSSKELLDKKDDKFYSLWVKNYKNSICIYLSSYKSGKDFVTIFDKNNNYKIISNDYIQTKRGESKEYDLYFKILEEKNPKLKN